MEDLPRVRASAENEEKIRFWLAKAYQDLVPFFEAAAEKGQCTVFWAS